MSLAQLLGQHLPHIALTGGQGERQLSLERLPQTACSRWTLHRWLGRGRHATLREHDLQPEGLVPGEPPAGVHH